MTVTALIPKSIPSNGRAVSPAGAFQKRHGQPVAGLRAPLRPRLHMRAPVGRSQPLAPALKRGFFCGTRSGGFLCRRRLRSALLSLRQSVTIVSRITPIRLDHQRAITTSGPVD